MDDEVKLIFMFGGNREKHKDAMRKLVKFAEEELKLELEERHCVGKNSMISWFDPDAARQFQEPQPPKSHAGFPVV
jgi:hypothetical protein